jgi:hypothetical protein
VLWSARPYAIVEMILGCSLELGYVHSLHHSRQSEVFAQWAVSGLGAAPCATSWAMFLALIALRQIHQMASQNIHFLTGNLLEDVAASKLLPSPAIGVSVACLDNGALCRLR